MPLYLNLMVFNNNISWPYLYANAHIPQLTYCQKTDLGEPILCNGTCNRRKTSGLHLHKKNVTGKHLVRDWTVLLTLCSSIMRDKAFRFVLEIMRRQRRCHGHLHRRNKNKFGPMIFKS